jgi:2-phosphosulfolactate phosphatase
LPFHIEFNLQSAFIVFIRVHPWLNGCAGSSDKDRYTMPTRSPRSPKKIEVLLTPAELLPLRDRDLSQTVCVVFDVLRATSSIVTALANGAEAIMPVEEISEALALRKQNPGLLLAGERHGVRIEGKLSGGVRFDFGNSPREFTPNKVRGQRIVTTTTNGTRALRACAKAKLTLVSSFLNLQATVDLLKKRRFKDMLFVCSGTFEECAYEDVLGAGALFAELESTFNPEDHEADSATLARLAWYREENQLLFALQQSRNGQRLWQKPDLRDDIPFCAQRDLFPIAVKMDQDGWLRKM